MGWQDSGGAMLFDNGGTVAEAAIAVAVSIAKPSSFSGRAIAVDKILRSTPTFFDWGTENFEQRIAS
jgi:hypothetical protein